MKRIRYEIHSVTELLGKFLCCRNLISKIGGRILVITMPEASGDNPGPSSSSNARIPNAITTGINKLRDKFRFGRQVQEGEIF